MVLSTQSQAYDCYFDKLKPGVTKKALEEINIFAYGSTDTDILTKQIYIEQICKGDDLRDILNLNIFLIFYKDKLIKVNYIHYVLENPILFQIMQWLDLNH